MPSPVELDIALKLLLAAIFGGLIGFERERDKRPAGLRTNMLICISAAIFGLIGTYAFPHDTGAVSRIWQNILTGVGFLGAGAVIKEEHSVHGLTTAATVWSVAAIGLALAAGLFFLAVAGELILLLTLLLVYRVEQRAFHKTPDDVERG